MKRESIKKKPMKLICKIGEHHLNLEKKFYAMSHLDIESEKVLEKINGDCPEGYSIVDAFVSSRIPSRKGQNLYDITFCIDMINNKPVMIDYFDLPGVILQSEKKKLYLPGEHYFIRKHEIAGNPISIYDTCPDGYIIRNFHIEPTEDYIYTKNPIFVILYENIETVEIIDDIDSKNGPGQPLQKKLYK